MFNERIKYLRNKHNLTQNEIADILNISKSTYIKYERGEREPRYGTLMALSEYYDVTVDFILGQSNEKNKHIDSINEVYKFITSDIFKEVLGENTENVQKLISDYIRIVFLIENVGMLDILYPLTKMEQLLIDIYRLGLHIFKYRDWADEDSEYKDCVPEPTCEDVTEFVSLTSEVRQIADSLTKMLTDKNYYSQTKLHFEKEISEYATIDRDDLITKFKLDPKYKM